MIGGICKIDDGDSASASAFPRPPPPPYSLPSAGTPPLPTPFPIKNTIEIATNSKVENLVFPPFSAVEIAKLGLDYRTQNQTDPPGWSNIEIDMALSLGYCKQPQTFKSGLLFGSADPP